MCMQAPHECLPSTKMEETKSLWRRRGIFGIFQRAKRTPSKVRHCQVDRVCWLISEGLEDENEFILIFDDGMKPMCTIFFLSNQ